MLKIGNQAKRKITYENTCDKDYNFELRSSHPFDMKVQ